jgi:hypothetical protein
VEFGDERMFEVKLSRLLDVFLHGGGGGGGGLGEYEEW